DEAQVRAGDGESEISCRRDGCALVPDVPRAGKRGSQTGGNASLREAYSDCRRNGALSAALRALPRSRRTRENDSREWDGDPGLHQQRLAKAAKGSTVAGH